MRILVFFDLPVTTPEGRKAAAKFRKFLIKDGYHMIQWSVYARVCNGQDAVVKHESRICNNLPSDGSIRFLTLTEKQFENMKVLLSSKPVEDKSEPPDLMSNF